MTFEEWFNGWLEEENIMVGASALGPLSKAFRGGRASMKADVLAFVLDPTLENQPADVEEARWMVEGLDV